MSVKVESDIPIPIMRGRYAKYPFGEMKKGDSFLLDAGAEVACVRQAASHYARQQR